MNGDHRANEEVIEALRLAHDLLTCAEIDSMARKARVKGFVPDVRKIGQALSNLDKEEKG